MKKFLIPACMLAMVMASCTLQEEAPVVLDGEGIVFRGNAYTATKMSIGEKDGEVFPLLWTTGDAIGIYSTDGTYSGERADLYTSSAGSSSGIFQAENDLIPASDMSLVVTYPYKTTLYSGGVITGTVPTTQTQSVANSTAHVGDGCVAYAETSVKAGQEEDVTFSLTHTVAVVKMVVGEISGYENCALVGASLTCDGVNLSGDVSYNISSGAMTVSNGSSTVGAVLGNTGAVLSEEQSVYFTAIPCDLTGKTVTAKLTLSAYGTETVFTIDIEGGELKASGLSIVKVSTSEYAWYSAVEARDLMGAYAYGPQNTVFIEQPTTGYGHVSIDVKARGDMSKVTKPKYYGLIVASDRSSSENTGHTADVGGGQRLLVLADGSDEHQEVPTMEVNDDYTIDVYCYPQGEGNLGNWGTVGIYDEDFELLWSFMVCKYLPGDEPTSVTYPDGTQFIDRVLGVPYSNKLAAEKGDFSAPSAAFFQWGRKDPFPWITDSFFVMYYESEASGIGAHVEDGIKNPTTAFGGGHDWLGYDYTQFDLWGVSVLSPNGSHDDDSSITGHKTIYDPCPEGYRVMDPRFCFRIYNRTDIERWEVNVNSTEQDSGYLNSDSPFYNNDQSVWVMRLADGSADYWPWFGFRWNNTTSLTKSDTWGRRSGLAFWSCCTYDDSADGQGGDGVGARYQYSSTSVTRYYGLGKEQAYPVRCQKE